MKENGCQSPGMSVRAARSFSVARVNLWKLYVWGWAAGMKNSDVMKIQSVLFV